MLPRLCSEGRVPATGNVMDSTNGVQQRTCNAEGRVASKEKQTTDKSVVVEGSGVGHSRVRDVAGMSNSRAEDIALPCCKAGNPTASLRDSCVVKVASVIRASVSSRQLVRSTKRVLVWETRVSGHTIM